MTGIVFPVISRYTGYVETVRVTHALGTTYTTRDSVIVEAARQGWALDHGCQVSLLDGVTPGGCRGLAFRTAAGRHIILDFTVKGAIKWCSIDGERVDRERYAAVVAALADGTVKPDGGHDLPQRIDPSMTQPQVLHLVRQVRTSGCVEYTARDGVTWRLTPSKISGSAAIWAQKVEH
jgi:hypothetical protein